jgi:hypothetical protein
VWEGKETRRRVDSTLPRLRCHGKEKRGGMWFPCRLVIDAAGRRENNEAACGFHATLLGSGLLPGSGCSPRPSSPVVPLLVRLLGVMMWRPRPSMSRGTAIGWRSTGRGADVVGLEENTTYNQLGS